MKLKNIFFLALPLMLLAELALAGNLEKAKDAFDRLDKNNLQVVEEFYDAEAVFQDPLHRIQGTQAIRRYYEGLYTNVESIRFEYKKTSEMENLVTLEWTMYLKTPSLNSGREFTLDGVSLILFGGREGKVIWHRDYFDMGEFVYERVPGLSWIINYIKGRMRGD